MDMIILSIHLIVSVCVVGLVLLQRSEGGALGIGGGGGGGALMSGRGASDAMARLTWIAGALFLGISLLLTWLSGASEGPRSSVVDTLSTAPITAPATPGPTEDAEPAAPVTPDPTESRAPSATEMAAAVLPGPSGASAAEPASASRAAPIEARQAASLQPAAAQRSAPRSETATPVSAPRPAAQNPAPQPLPVEVSAAESVDPSAGVETVRRERAGPDQ